MPNPPKDAATRLATIVESYRQHDNLGALFDELRALEQLHDEERRRRSDDGRVVRRSGLNARS